MKLVDILARELKAWPNDEFDSIGQAKDGSLHKSPNWYVGCGWTKEKYTLAEDWYRVHVTRTQWQAAVDALKSEKGAGMIISDPIQMRINAFGDEAFSLLREQYENGSTMKIGDKEFIATNLGRNISGEKTSECHSNIQEFYRVQMPWLGNGLPPIDTVCEMSIGDPANGKWITGTVVCHINWERPVAVAHDGVDVFHGYAEDFRPIRTTEQIAADAVEQKLCEDVALYGTSFALTNDDGSLTRLDPTKVVIRGQAVSLKL